MLSIMQRLRDETSEHHKRAEGRPLEQNLASGRITRETYAAYLGQRLLIHSTLESEAVPIVEGDSRLAGLIPPNLLQEANLRADLQWLDVNVDAIEPLPSAQALIAEIRRWRHAQPAAVLGVFYVFEGSKNGARFIARALMKGLGLAPGPGLRYLDPHGDAQRGLWVAFKERMDRVEFSAEERDAMVSAARFTFDRVAELDDELHRSTAGRPVPQTA